MQCNVGGVDRKLRFGAGVVIMGLGLYFGSWWGLVGVVVFLTAVFAVCPAYLPFGVSTCKVNTPATTPEAPTQTPPQA